MKVKRDNGKVVVGQDRIEPGLIEDPYNVLTMSVFGHNTSSASNRLFRTGAKLAFGDFGRRERNGWNVFVGEYGENDTDRLWLHGKNGIHITYNNGQDQFTIFRFDASNTQGVYIDGEIKANGLKIPAIRRENVSALSNIYQNLMSLNCYQYNFRATPVSTAGLPALNSGDNEKENYDIQKLRSSVTALNNNFPMKYGFDYQQLEHLFPALVEYDDTNEPYIDYISLIPVLVQVIKQQGGIILAQSLKIKELENDVVLMTDNTFSTSAIKKKSVKKSVISDQDDYLTDNAFLYQNTPNPFDQSTEIKYFLPDDIGDSYIYIFNMQGTMLLSFKLIERGFGSISVDSYQLSAGMYLYSLYIGGKEIQTKKMILTK